MRRVAEMGEVFVATRLTNMFDRESARHGERPDTDVRSVVEQAVVDTGAVMSVLPHRVVDLLGLPIDRMASVALADGSVQEVGVVYGALFGVLDREAAEEAYVLGNEVLIGQTGLEKLDLLVDCANRRLIGRHPGGTLHRV